MHGVRAGRLLTGNRPAFSPRIQKEPKMAATVKNDPNIRVLRAIAGGARSLAELKKALRKDARAAVSALRKDGSVDDVEDVGLVLTRRGAGRLRFAD